MKLLYITSSWFFDADFSLIKQLVEDGVDVLLCIKVYAHSLTSTILDFKSPCCKTGIFDSSIYGDSIDRLKKHLNLEKIYVINHEHGDNSLKNISIEREEKKMIEAYNPDVIQYVGWPSIYEIPILLRYGEKIIVTVHDPVPHEVSKKTKLNQIIRRFFYRSIGFFILLNHKQLDDFLSFYKIEKDKVRFARLGTYDVLKAFGTKRKTNSRNILFFGRISPYKGVEYLLEAYYPLMDEYADSKLIVAGGGRYHFDLSPYVNHAQIEFINEYLSPERLSTLIQEAEFVVCPYVSATQSGVVASAYAFNKPIIATKVGGLPEMIEDRKTGLLIEPKNVECLRSSIRFFLDNPDVVNSMSEYIKKLAADGPNAWSRIALDYLSCYEEVLSR